MRILHLSTSDNAGGAPRAALRLHHGLREAGVDSIMRVQQKNGDDEFVLGPANTGDRLLALFRPTLDRLTLFAYPGLKRHNFSPAMIPDNLATQVRRLEADVAHLHWIAGGFLRIESLSRFSMPLVWTLHDMWAFTGGCHYSGDCERYRESCGNCPNLGSGRINDASRRVWSRKRRAMESLNLTVVAPSRWLAECARGSSLFRERRVIVIPNGIDTHQYKPVDRRVARELLSLPVDRKLVMFGAVRGTIDPRKGFQHLAPALRLIAGSRSMKNVEVIIFGSSRPKNPPDLGFPAHYLGNLQDETSLSLAYAAADVYISPAVQENLSNTILEALACGRPCVAFNIGGMPDMIDHEQNGYLARPFQIEDLAEGISWVLGEEDRWQRLSREARRKAEEQFAIESIARRHAALYEEILATARR